MRIYAVMKSPPMEMSRRWRGGIHWKWKNIYINFRTEHKHTVFEGDTQPFHVRRDLSRFSSNLSANKMNSNQQPMQYLPWHHTSHTFPKVTSISYSTPPNELKNVARAAEYKNKAIAIISIFFYKLDEFISLPFPLFGCSWEKATHPAYIYIYTVQTHSIYL